MDKQRKFFLCIGKAVGAEDLNKYKGSHIIGELIRVIDEGVRVTALAYYELSRPVSDFPIAMPALRMEIVGDARNIRCTCCDHKPRWEISKAAAQQIVHKYVAE